MKEETLYELVRKSQEGDQEALMKIVQKYRPLIRKRLYGVHPQERADLEQALVEKLIGTVLRAEVRRREE
ncbi:helix-turn-helix domain-containing protein [Paenibacillus alkalitolerans]|uniref:helix-turn-helix domain-containing protein n=1 Tax=Paenibacillus alkalitolerans TaxID=2799335 RepID=UPI0018F6BBEF|nr:helix-turn-helix domain-containing protein [Paenibacillus alkalitolerans]